MASFNLAPPSPILRAPSVQTNVSAAPTSSAPSTPTGGGPPGSASAAAPAIPVPPPWDGIPTGPIAQLSLRALLTLLDTIPESKTLMLDPSLAGPLGLVADVDSLRQHGVEKMYWMEEDKEDSKGKAMAAPPKSKALNAPTRSVVYICRPQKRWMRVIASNILADRAASPQHLQHTYTALMTPRRTELSLLSLSQSGVPSDLTIHDYGLEFVPLERDLLSLEDDNAWPAIFRDGDHTAIHHSAMALMTMQLVYGLFPRIVGKGDLAKRLCDLLIRQRREHLAADPSNPALTTPSSTIDSLIIVDRSVDLASPLCSQLTYEGLLSEIVGIRSAHIEVDASVLASQAAAAPNTPSSSGTPLQLTTAPRKKKHRLDATTDTILASVRDENFSLVPERINLLAKRLQADLDGRHAVPMSAQHRAFVARLGALTAEKANLQLHIALQEQVMEVTTSEEFLRALEIQQSLVAGADMAAQQTAIEELINSEATLPRVLRLLCLASVVGGGLKPKSYEFVKRELLQTYGYQHLPLLLALDKVGLLTRQGAATSSRSALSSSTSGFANVRRALRLINDEVDERDPADISYVYSGYAPLSVRLVQAVAQKEALVDDRRYGAGGVEGGVVGAGAAGKRANAKVKPRAHPIVGWKGFEDVVDSLPGATFDEIQSSQAYSDSGDAKNGTNGTSVPTSASSTSANLDPDAVTTTIVFFLGGVTAAEVAALRFMGRQTRNRRFLVCTTNTISGDSMVLGLAR